MNDDIREALAAYAHTAWSGWMKYLFEQCFLHGPGHTVITSYFVERWQRQMNTEYADLPESEKESDRKEADQMLQITGIEQLQRELKAAENWAVYFNTGGALKMSEEIVRLRKAIEDAISFGDGAYSPAVRLTAALRILREAIKDD